MATRAELQKLAKLRLKEAEALYRQKLYDGAAYLCGYSIECALKARICKLLDVADYPSKRQNLKSAYTSHDLGQLLFLAGLSSGIGLTQPELQQNWSIVAKWRSERRYDTPGKYSQRDALEVLDAIRSQPHGVLRWLMKRW